MVNIRDACELNNVNKVFNSRQTSLTYYDEIHIKTC